jgi:alpha-mannosidase
MKKICLALLAAVAAMSVNAQENPDKAYFVDGYHGGVYGHYPLEWKTQFIVDQLAEHPEWRIGLEIEPETWDSVKVHTPMAYDAFRRIAADRRVEFTNPNYAQPYAYNVSGESLIRQFEYGIRKTREHFPDVEFLTYAVEEPCFTSSLPQILKGFGYKYAVLKNPNTCWGGYTAAHGGQLVNWIGPDGSSILTVPRYAAEALEDNSVWQTKAWGNSTDYIEACLAAGIANPVGMTYQDAGWRGGPWIGSGDDIRNNSTYVTWREYMETVAPEYTTDDYRMPLEDVRPALMWGSQVMQRIGRQVRQSENKVVMAEKVAAIVGLTDRDYRYPQAEIDEAWRTLMLAQHHDSWIVPYNGLHGKGTWADAIERWTGASDKIADEVAGEATEDNSEGEYVTLYNTLGVARTEVVDIAGVPTEVKVPAFGFASYRIEPAVESASEATARSDGKVVLENDIYRIEIDAARGGTISSLRVKGREFTEQGEFSFGELRGHFYDEGRFRSSTEAVARVTLTEDNPLRKTALIEGEIAGHPFTQTITIRKGDRKIDFALKIDWRENVGIGEFRQTDAYKSNRRAFYDDRFKLNVLFPVALESPTLHKDAPFDVAKSELDNTFFNTWDSIKHNIIVRWVDISEREGSRRGHGLALLTDHTTSYSYGEDFPLALTAQFSGGGLWGRDYIIDRPTEMRFAVVPHSGSWDKADVQNESARWNEPLIASAGGTDRGSRWLVEVGRRSGYEISAAYPVADGTLVRIYNASGKDKKQKVSFGFPVESVTEVDLNGDPIGEPLKVRGGKSSASVKVKMPRFGFRTFIVAKSSLPEK